MRAPVNKIIDSSVVDGPGNRTVIFFQSCNFNCRYCHNPETIHMCQNCYKCVEGCPKGALTIEDGKVCYDYRKCCNCDNCIKVCPNNASPKIRYLSVDEVVEAIEDNMPFIRGVTVSGGECSLQMPFVLELFKRVKELGLTALLDSNGSYDFEKNPEILKYADGVMLDIKATNPTKHLWVTGRDNEFVLKNAKYLASVNKLTEIRTVCIMESLDSVETIKDTAALLKDYIGKGDINYKLIKYRPFGVREQYQDLIQPTDEDMESFKKEALAAGFKKITVI